MNLHILAAASSETGRRPANEDYYCIDAANGLYEVADGTASRGGGRTAAVIACDTVRETLQQQSQALDGNSGENVAEILRNAIIHANQRIQERQLTDPDLSRMATTFVMCLFRNNGIHIAYVGDSRLYLYRNGELLQLTRDHSLANYLKDHPEVRPSVQRPGKTLLSALGLKQSQLRIDYLHQTLEPDDLLILCSDGLTDAIPEWILREILAGAYITDIEDTVTNLTRSAMTHGGMDNITMVLLHATEQPLTSEGQTVIFELDALPGKLAPSKKFLGWLTFAEGPRQGEVIKLDQRMTFGATDKNAVVMTGDDFISSQHAEVIQGEYGFLVRDLNSTNGTFINNIRIKEENLVDGDTLRIGTTPLIFKDFKF